jgi:hypothetical protein
MNRKQLEHVIRAAGAITSDDEFIVIGSQSILGAYPEAPGDLLRSMDLDLYPKNLPEQSIAVDGAIGEGSMFHQTFGYYAHGVGPDTAVLPNGWQDRLVAVKNENTRGVTGWCLDPSDLAVSKLVAGREHDLEFVAQMFRHGLLDVDRVRERLETTPIDRGRRAALRQRFDSLR